MRMEPEGLTFEYPGRGYASQKELLADLKAVLDQRLGWLAAPDSSAARNAWEGLSPEQAEELDFSDEYLSGRFAATRRGAVPLRDLALAMELDGFETRCAALCLHTALDAMFRRRLAQLQDGAEGVSFALAARILAPRGADIARYAFRAAHFDKPFRLFLPSGEGGFWLDEGVLAYLLGQPILADGLEVLPPLPTQTAPVREEYVRLLELWLAPPGSLPRLIALSAPSGAGKRYLARQALSRMGRPMILLDVRSILNDPAEGLRRAYTQMLLHAGVLCAVHFEALLEAGAESRRMFFGMLKRMPRERTAFLLSERAWKNPDITSDFLLEEITLPELSPHERFLLFRHAGGELPLAQDVDFRELAVKFRFWPGQVVNAMLQLRERCALTGEPADSAMAHHCCYAQAVHRLDDLAARVTPAYGWDDLVLPGSEISLLQQACRRVQHQHRVFHDWGFDKRVSYGKGVSMMFSGPPGTGKTMAAQVVANQLHMQLYQIQLSQVVSKYVGETEKNLRELFREARAGSCILFFDECDALFGKRGEVKDSNDRYANIEVAYLLQQVEAHEGVSILATNLLQNIDPAFMRRLSFVVHFPFPDLAMRRSLFEKMLPPGTPRAADIDFDLLAEKFNVSGGSIKNIVLHAAFEAAAQGEPVGMVHLLRAGVAEFRKNDIIILREDMREYADLVF